MRFPSPSAYKHFFTPLIYQEIRVEILQKLPLNEYEETSLNLLHSKLSSRDSLFQIKLEGKHDYEELDVLLLTISKYSIFSVVKSTRFHLHLSLYLPPEKCESFDAVWEFLQIIKEPIPIKLRKLSTLVTAFRELTALNAIDEVDFELNQNIIAKVETTMTGEGLKVTTLPFQERLTRLLNPSQVHNMIYFYFFFCTCFNRFFFFFVPALTDFFF